jgi:chloramphenicol 3-O phosphotransferase
VLFRQTGSVTDPGQIVILNGAPRSGKSAIASAAQEIFSGLWVNLGVDASMRSIPERLRPGIGLRPGGERPDLEDTVLLLYAALYESIAAHARLGVNVVTDVGHHESYSKPLRILPDCAMRLSGFPVLWVGVRCPIGVIWQRREESWGQSFDEAENDLRNVVKRWQREVHAHGDYDVEVDSSILGPDECAQVIAARLFEEPPGRAFASFAVGK